MKPLSFLILMLALCANACSPDHSNANTDVDAIRPIDTTSEPRPIKMPEPPKTAPVKGNEEKSIFKNLGCCADAQKRKTEDCCCTLILKEWKEMHQSEDSRISDIMGKDPILSDCRKKRLPEFEDIEEELVDQPF